VPRTRNSVADVFNAIFVGGCVSLIADTEGFLVPVHAIPVTGTSHPNARILDTARAECDISITTDTHGFAVLHFAFLFVRAGYLAAGILAAQPDSNVPIFANTDRLSALYLALPVPRAVDAFAGVLDGLQR
jgi:hypothetical protein